MNMCTFISILFSNLFDYEALFCAILHLSPGTSCPAILIVYLITDAVDRVASGHDESESVTRDTKKTHCHFTDKNSFIHLDLFQSEPCAGHTMAIKKNKSQICKCICGRSECKMEI